MEIGNDLAIGNGTGDPQTAMLRSFVLYRSLLRPILFRLPAETAHNLAMHFLSLPLATHLVRLGGSSQSATNLEIERFGLKFSNPVGLAAGFDKDAVALPALSALGFGFIEGGTVTNLSQPGNEYPRLFRLPADRALINRAGFNNEGAIAFAKRVSKHRPDCVLGISIGKSKLVPLEEAVDDYLKSFEAIFPVADYVAVNVSSPNTPRLRELQNARQLEGLVSALNQRNSELTAAAGRDQNLPLLVKLAPELELRELELVADVARRTGVSALIATNTTAERNGLTSPAEMIKAIGEGGLSGAPLRRRSTEVIATLYRITHGSIPLIGVGGIFSAEDAWEKICAGASLVQLYTGFIYEGPRIAQRINEGLAAILVREGLHSLDEAVGCRSTRLAYANTDG